MRAGAIRSGGVRISTPENLPGEKEQLILGSDQFSDANRITPKHFRGDPGWIIAGTENDDFRARILLQQTLKVAVGRDQDEIVRNGVFQNLSIARASSSRDFGARQFGRIRVYGKEIIRLELGVIGKDLLLGRPVGEPFQNLLNGDPVAANTRLAESHIRIDGDPL
jgi:hypothetical protein